MIKQLLSMTLALGLSTTALAQVGADAKVPLETAPSIMDSKSFVDTYDPTKGPYGPGNIYDAPTFTTGNFMPDLTAPTGLGSQESDVTYQGKKGGDPIVLSQSMTCDNLTIGTWTELVVEGKVTIVVKKDFLMQSQSKITLAQGAKLTIYLQGQAAVMDQSYMNPDSSRPKSLMILKLGTSPLRVENQSSISAVVFSPKARLEVRNGSDFYGMLMAKSLLLENTAAAHFTDFNAIAPTTVAPLYD